MRTRLLLATLGLVVSSACADGSPGSSASTPCPSPVPVTATDPFLSVFPLERWGIITDVSEKGMFEIANVVASQSVVELHPQIARAVIDSKYDIIGADNEGFESEIYFALRGKFAGSFRLREGPCGDQVTVRLLLARKRGGS